MLQIKRWFKKNHTFILLIGEKLIFPIVVEVIIQLINHS
jgi:hypothetical protein